MRGCCCRMRPASRWSVWSRGRSDWSAPEKARPSRRWSSAAAAREPIAQIVGCREFWSLPFLTTRDTLTPRPDSEAVVEAALRLLPGPEVAAADPRSGNRDRLPAAGAAVRIPGGDGPRYRFERRCGAGCEAKRRGARLRRPQHDPGGRMGRRRGGRVRPYRQQSALHSAAELDRLAPEIRCFEPRLALDGGPDGLDAYRALAPRLYRRLRPGGHAVLEVGSGQAGRSRRSCNGAGLATRGRQRDLSGVDRCTIVQR